MNSEELEQSLRSEFENYLKDLLAEMKQEAAEFQKKIEGEFDKHRSEYDNAFRAFAARFDSEGEFDEAFKGSISEHLRLARDEGAKITANAFAEAEKLEKAAAPATSFDGIRDAVQDISSKDSQSAILKSLIHHASSYAPRGAFFIIKNEHFAGWKVFGSEVDGGDNAIREIHFPVAADSIIGTAVKTLSTVDSAAGAHGADAAFLDPLQFGHPDRMYAIPLVARGKGVAVMYADYGSEGVHLNREALETLVRVAGLTVELIALSQTVRPGEAATDLSYARDEVPQAEAAAPVVETVREMPATEPAPDFSFSDSPSYAESFPEADAAVVEEVEREPQVVAIEEEVSNGSAAFETAGSIEETPIESPSPFETPAEEFAPVGATVGGFEPAVEVATQPVKRLSDRPVDLPIDVPEDQRRLHNDARRFARLLVSEIKLYNEKKVIEGREAGDLYGRLREAIDRSREMYDKRVQPPVAASYDYFHYEIVNSLADGDAARLGDNYPGASV